MGKRLEALRLRKTGMTLQAIGEVLGATREGVRKMILLAEEQEKYSSTEFSGLSLRVAKAISKVGLTKAEVLRIVLDPNVKRFVIQGVGDKGMAELKQWASKQ